MANRHPLQTVTVEQIYAALVQLGAAPVLDPEQSPDGPTEDDLPALAGVLLAVTEWALSIEQGDDALPMAIAGYIRRLGAPADGSLNLAMVSLYRFVLLRETLWSLSGGHQQLTDACQQSADATAKLLRLLLLHAASIDIEIDPDPDRAKFRETLADVRERLRAVTKSLDTAANDLLQASHDKKPAGGETTTG